MGERAGGRDDVPVNRQFNLVLSSGVGWGGEGEMDDTPPVSFVSAWSERVWVSVLMISFRLLCSRGLSGKKSRFERVSANFARAQKTDKQATGSMRSPMSPLVERNLVASSLSDVVREREAFHHARVD